MTPTAPHSGDAAMSGSISTMTGLDAVDSRGVQLVSARQPGPPSGDQYLGAEIQELTRRGVATDLRTSTTVAGRAGGPSRVGGPPSRPGAPPSGTRDHADPSLGPDGVGLRPPRTSPRKRARTGAPGSERGGALPCHDGDTVTAPVDLAGLGPATTAVRSDGFELRIDLGGGQWVRVRGTLPLDDLVSYGHRLTRAAVAPTAG